MYFIDDPYGQQCPQICSEDRDEIEEMVSARNEARADWNHNQGPNWPAIVGQCDGECHDCPFAR